MELLKSHRVFETNELDEGSRFGDRSWERNQATWVEGPYGLRWNQAEFDRTAFSYVEHDAAVDLISQGPLSDYFRIYFHKSGSIQHTLNGQQFVSDPHNPVVHAPSIDMKLNIRPFKLLMVSVGGEIVRNALAQRFGRLSGLETWVGALRPLPAVDTLESMATWFCQELERPGSLLAMPGKPRQHAKRMLLATFVECLAEMVPPKDAAVLDIGELQIRRAEEWIDEHLTEAIGVEEIARALGVGVRSLQRTFRRVRNCSPMEAVLQRRLERAQQALLAAAPGVTVTAIAMEFAFLELGRFARQYKAHFGESPSETLKRRIGPVAYDASPSILSRSGARAIENRATAEFSDHTLSDQ